MTMAKTEAASEEQIVPAIAHLRRIEDHVMVVRIEGVTPVIPHRWSEKSRRMMLESMQGPRGKTRAQREAKNPEQEAHDSCYWLGDSAALPAVSFKASMVGACRFFEGITMTLAKLLFYVEGDGPDQLVPIKGDPVMREDTPRNSSGTPDLRYRYQFHPWSASLRIHYLPSMIDTDSVVNLLDMGGKGGVGDWRPSSPKSSTGTFGQFKVVA